MLSLVSSQTRRITAWPSAPIALATAPISLANATLTAWKLLQAYFTSAAVRGSVTCLPASTAAYRSSTGRACASSSAPTSTYGGW